MARQQSLGNQAVQRLLRSKRIQAELAINEPGDRYEQEADRVAEAVTQATGPETLHDGGSTLTSFASARIGLQRKCACGGTPGPDGECAACRAKRLALQRRSTGHAGPSAVPPIVHEVLRSPGQPLDTNTRTFMETRFGRDFGEVRVHTDARAAGSARAVNALAYTVGRDIVFGAGQYAPRAATGQRVLAHELTHVVQQSEAIGDAWKPALLDREAETRVADSVQGRLGVARLQRQADIEQAPLDLSCDVRVTGAGHISGTDILFGIESAALTNEQKSRDVADFVSGWVTAGSTDMVQVDGYASVDGPQGLNWRLSCKRAESIKAELIARGVPEAKITTVAHGESTEFSTTAFEPNRRAIIIRRPLPAPPTPTPVPPAPPTPTPVPVPDDAPEYCTPARGLPPTDCSLYRANEFWLPSAYVHNATCACQQTPNSTTANCVRKLLQDRLNATPQSDKDFWTRMKELEYFSKGEYDQELLNQGLTQRIFHDHVVAYSKCCCPSGPAPFTAWIGVTTIPLGCDAVGIAIRRFGSCHGTPGAW